MSNMLRITTVALVAALGFLSFAAPAAAAGYLTFVSATGNDANSCLVQAQPCKTLQKAVNVTAANGEVRLLTRLSAGAVVNQSITIDGADNTVIGQIFINNASAKVTLRRLNLNGRGAVLHGINVASAAVVQIEDCTIERYTSDGISLIATTATKLFISNSALRANGSDGLHVEDTNAKAEIENARFEGNNNSGVYLKVKNANITRSGASGNASSGIALRVPNAKITETTADDNLAGSGFLIYEGTAVLDSAETNGNGVAGLEIAAGANALINHCIFMENQGAIVGIKNGGQFGSDDNSIVFSRSGTPPTPLPHQ